MVSPCRTLGEHLKPPPFTRWESGVVMPVVKTDNFDLNFDLVMLIKEEPFRGTETENPYDHLANFIEFLNTVKYKGVSDDALRMRLFQFSLSDKAKDWYYSIPSKSIKSWKELHQAFIRKFFPPMKLVAEITSFESGVVMPDVEADTFDLDPDLIKLIQSRPFRGTETENPYWHVRDFLDIMNIIMKYEGVSDDALRLRLFPFSLSEQGKAWYRSIPTNSIKSWEELEEAFLTKFFPPRKVAEGRAKIRSFEMLEGELFYEAWERFNHLLYEYPMHGLQKVVLLVIFYYGVDDKARESIQLAARYRFLDMKVDNGWELIDRKSDDSRMYSFRPSKFSTGVEMEDEFSSVDLAQELADLNIVCQLCGVPNHTARTCLANTGPSQVRRF